MFKKKMIHVALALSCLFVLASCNSQEGLEDLKHTNPALSQTLNERVVVCNRGSGDISVIDAVSNTVIGTYALPDNGQPMYAVHIPQAKKVFVGDRTNNRVVAFNEDNFAVEGTVPCGNGVFHMWASPNGNQLWVNNDIDNTTTVINPVSMTVKGTAVTPADLVALGGKPHDVIVSPDRQFAFVSVLGVSGANDFVVKYNTSKYEEVGRVAVGKDPHLSATSANDLLYVACQSGEIYIVDRDDLSVNGITPFSGSHGAGMTNSGDFFYTTDLPGGRFGLIDTDNGAVVGTPINTPFPIPHNIAINASDDKAFVTHSGATADKFTIYSLNPSPSLITSLTLGTNPFGLVYYNYK